MGQLYLTQKRPHQAIEHLRAALALNSEDEFNYFNLAVAYQANGDKKEAIEFYQQFLSRAKSGEKWDKSVFQAEAAIAKLKKK